MKSSVKSLLSGIGLHFGFDNGTEDAKFNVSQYKNPDSYDLETRKIINTVTLEDKSNPVGSQKYKVHRYPGDIDILERIKVCCSLDQATRTIVKKIQQTIRDILSVPHYYLGDFKAGLDLRFQLELNQPVPKIINDLMSLHRNKLLTSDEVESLITMLKSNQMGEFKEALRKHSVIRWTAQEILDGKKQLVGNVTLSLFDAIKHPTLVKLDLWAPTNGNYTEITNFLLLMYTDEHGRSHPVNIGLADRISSLIGDIKLYSSGSHKKSLKVAKRMWALAQSIDDQTTIEKLYPLFSSDAAIMSQVSSEIETLCLMLTKLDKPPLDIMIKQIDHFKTRIGNIMISLDESAIFGYINTITKMYQATKNKIDKELVINILKQVAEHLNKVVEQYSSAFLEHQGLLDPEYYDHLLKKP
jgi:hypothetical protein